MGTLLLIAQLSGLIAFVTLIWLAVRAFKKHILWGIAVLLLSPITATIFGILHWKDAQKPFLAYIASFLVSVTLGLYVFTAWGGWEVGRTAFDVREGIHDKTLSEQDAMAFMRAGLDFAENADPTEQELKKLNFMRKFMDRYEHGMTEADQQELNRELLDLMEGEDLSEQERRELDALRAQLQIPETDSGETPAEAKFDKETWLKGSSRRSSIRSQNQRREYVTIEPGDASNYIGKTFRVTRRNGVEQQVVLKGASRDKLLFERRTSGGTITFNYYHRDITQLKVLQWQVAGASGG